MAAVATLAASAVVGTNGAVTRRLKPVAGAALAMSLLINVESSVSVLFEMIVDIMCADSQGYAVQSCAAAPALRSLHRLRKCLVRSAGAEVPGTGANRSRDAAYRATVAVSLSRSLVVSARMSV